MCGNRTIGINYRIELAKRCSLMSTRRISHPKLEDRPHSNWGSWCAVCNRWMISHRVIEAASSLILNKFYQLRDVSLVEQSSEMILLFRQSRWLRSCRSNSLQNHTKAKTQCLTRGQQHLMGEAALVAWCNHRETHHNTKATSRWQQVHSRRSYQRFRQKSDKIPI